MPLILALMLAVAAHAFAPAPVTRSQGEIIVADAKLAQLDSAQALELGLQLLEQFSTDVPAGREVQIAIRKFLPDAPEFYRERHTRLNNPASFYLYARSTNFQLPESEVAAWVEREPRSIWMWLCYMATEWHKEAPNSAVVLERIEQAIISDPSRPEGYSFLGMYYDEQEDLAKAREAYEAGLITDPKDENMRNRLLDICLLQRDAQGYFAVINGVIPDQPLDVELGTLGHPEQKVKPEDLRGHVSLLVYWSLGSEICINHTLAEINKAIDEKKIKWPVYAVHVGGDSTDATALITETDRNGIRWSVNFVKSADDLDLRLDAPKRPCVYVVGADGYVHALITGRGHETDLLQSVIWLAEQVQTGM